MNNQKKEIEKLKSSPSVFTESLISEYEKLNKEIFSLISEMEDSTLTYDYKAQGPPRSLE